MTDKELNIALREMARNIGACDKVVSEWKDDDTVDVLLERYIHTFDFALEKDFPKISFIREHFRKEDLHRHHIYVDEGIEIKDADNGFYVFLGDCKGYLHVTGFKAVTVLVRHGSKIDVQAFDGAMVQVRYYDGSDGVCKSDGYSRVMKISK